MVISIFFCDLIFKRTLSSRLKVSTSFELLSTFELVSSFVDELVTDDLSSPTAASDALLASVFTDPANPCLGLPDLSSASFFSISSKALPSKVTDFLGCALLVSASIPPFTSGSKPPSSCTAFASSPFGPFALMSLTAPADTERGSSAVVELLTSAPVEHSFVLYPQSEHCLAFALKLYQRYYQQCLILKIQVQDKLKQ